MPLVISKVADSRRNVLESYAPLQRQHAFCGNAHERCSSVLLVVLAVAFGGAIGVVGEVVQ